MSKFLIIITFINIKNYISQARFPKKLNWMVRRMRSADLPNAGIF